MAYEPGEPEFNPPFAKVDRLTELDEELTEHPDLFAPVDEVDAQTKRAAEIARKIRDAKPPEEQAKFEEVVKPEEQKKQAKAA
jgi:hypothetical protein